VTRSVYALAPSPPIAPPVNPAHIGVSEAAAGTQQDDQSVKADHLPEQCCVAITHVVRECALTHIPPVSNVALQQTKGPER
jgi:hypothetical protein